MKKILTIIGSVALCACILSGCDSSDTITKETPTGNRFTLVSKDYYQIADTDAKFYVIKDNETNNLYLLEPGYAGTNCLCPLYNAEGKIAKGE